MPATLFAHGGEIHQSTSSGASHLLESPSYVLFFWVAGIVTLVFITSAILHLKRASQAFLLASAHLAYGVYLGYKSSALGAVMISIGFAIILLSVIVDLQNGAQPKQTIRTHKEARHGRSKSNK